ncbi:MAG: DUF89 family protein [Oscillospiraceae bacterium]|nr:DUF89 family protein [Oscillospiraceae bacterium]
MSIPMNAQCYLCHLKRNTETARAMAGDEAATAFAKDLMQLYLEAPKEKSSPWFGPGVTALLEKHCGLTEDRFKAEKEQSNRFVLQRLENIRGRIYAAEDPLYAALQMAVLGNYIDFSALKGEVSFEKLDEMLEQAENIQLDRQKYAKLRSDLKKGKKLLYITDNAGEIGFDRLLAEQMQEQYPELQITFCVRGGPASNDATREDAAEVGISFPVIDNGCTVAGTELELLPKETLQIFEQADVILSKGQANVETLYGCGLNIYYLFLIKCARFQDYFGKEKLTPMLLTER